MSIESRKASVRRFHDAVEPSNLYGVRTLTTKDTDWAAKVLEQAFFSDPLLNYIYGDQIDKQGKLNWFFRVTFRFVALNGGCFSTTEKDDVLMMLPPDQANMTIDKMVRSGLWAAPFKMGWASFSRMIAFIDFAEKFCYTEIRLRKPNILFFCYCITCSLSRNHGLKQKIRSEMNGFLAGATGAVQRVTTRF